MSETKITQQLDYSKSAEIKPEYKFHKINPKEGTGNIIVTTAGGSTSSFDLPQRVFNLNRSILTFTAAPPATANRYNFKPMDCMSYIHGIKLLTPEGTILCDMTNVNNMTKMVWKPETEFEKYMTFEAHDVKVVAGVISTVGAGGMLQPCRVTNKLKFTDVAAEFKAAFYDAVDFPTNAAAMRVAVKRPAVAARRHDDAGIANGTGDVSAVNVAFLEPKYLSAGTLNNASPVLNIQINLGMIYNTIFELDKDLLFSQILALEIIWAPSTKIYFTSLDPLSPGNTPLEATGNVTISDLRLYLAVEQKQEIINALRAKVASGSMSILFPSTRVYKNSRIGAGLQTVALKFTRGHGLRLQRIYHSLFDTDEESYTLYDNDAREDLALTSYNTYLDSQARNEFEVKCGAGQYEDYLLHKARLEGSVILNSDVYKYNWFVCDDFTGSSDPLWRKDHNKASGLDLTTERTWEITTEAAGDTIHYTVCVFQRMLKISATETVVE